MVAAAPTRFYPSSLAVDAYRGTHEVINELADQWRELCNQAVDDQPFYRPEWIGAYVRAFAPRADLFVLAVRMGTSLQLVLPLVAKRSTLSVVPLRTLHAPVNSHSCRFDALRRRGDEGSAAIDACWDYLKNLGGWDLIHFANVPAEGTLERLTASARKDGFRTAVVPERPNPIVPVPEDVGLLAKMPTNPRLRTKLRQVRRQLTRRAPLRFSRTEIADPGAVQRFYELEASGWKGQEHSAILSNSETKHFYDEVADAASRHGYFSLYTLHLGDELLAAHFSLTYNGRCYSPKVAYNEKFKEFAPGHLIVSEILRDCSQRGIRLYDITGPDDDWKMKWTHLSSPVNHLFIFGHSTAARTAHALRFRLRPAVGRLLRSSKIIKSHERRSE